MKVLSFCYLDSAVHECAKVSELARSRELVLQCSKHHVLDCKKAYEELQEAGPAWMDSMLFLVSASMASEDVRGLDGTHGDEVLHVHANEPNGMWHAGIGADSQASCYTCMYILVFPWGPVEDLCTYTCVFGCL